jgi:signal transduction histidine kinase
VGVLADVTERKRQQEVQRRLEARQQHARRLESLGVFAGGIAHDFNNMLAAIVGFGELARQEVPEDSEAAQYLNDVLQAAARATELVTQVLTFSRSTEGEPRPVALSPLVTESMRFVRATLPASIEFRHEVVRDAGRLIADPTQLQQVILNLCNNAEHAMREHGGLLEVTRQAVALAEGDETGPTQLPPGHYAELTVRDTGCGISPDHLDRIFDPFYTTKELGEGTGLGLSTVHGIVTQCGGAITVESEVGVGTKFRVYLPSSEAEAADGHHRP